MEVTPPENVSSNNPTVLIVDDEASIRQSLEVIFRDEGFNPVVVGDGLSALNVLAHTRPALILLDIWMPGIDGIETLKKIKEIYPDLGVIMMSGHATIATAIKATRMGASDFVEKPLDLDSTIQAARRVLGLVRVVDDNQEDRMFLVSDNDKTVSIGHGWGVSHIHPMLQTAECLRGRNIGQRTLSHSALLYGQGLHSGKKSGLILEPLPLNSGIQFVGVSEPTLVPAHVDFVESTGFATTVRLGGTQAGTIEHLMSALHAYKISNLLIKCNGEVPVMDGSAKEFCHLFEETGIEEQAGEWYEIKVPHEITIGNEREFIKISPGDEFEIDYTLKYPEPIGVQHYVFTLKDVERYKNEIAAARTFGFVKDIGALQKQGLALGGRFDNFVLIGADGAINDSLRYDDELVRHKILDVIGDLFLLGRPIVGKVTANMTGHSDNVALVRRLKSELEAQLGLAAVNG